ncbi:hypothetical protein FOMPIDRAFT_90552 [Fomitopsis schrenkii]|uniref:Uncharacterized protein n=1 Tax=Fomitopsis schrenkii TaxID=2126942 RepID=S8FAW8_FOMSC|nr:hypothetical protein FOMPIDRAFT_90552 [Fomitopsis schrenkii]
MGQYWKLINIDRKLASRFQGLKLGEFLFGTGPTRLVRLLAMPRKSPPYDRSIEERHSTDTRDLGALNIPTDILEFVFEEFGFEPHDIRAIVSLSLTNTFLREIGQKRLWDLMSCSVGAWWLDRLICVGDYVDGDDLPANIFRGEEEEKTLTGNHDDDDDESGGARIYDKFEVSYLDDIEALMSWSTMCRHVGTGDLSRKERRMAKEMVNPDYSWDGRPETEWILCNWTMAEYVRASAVAELTGTRCNGPWTHNFLSLGHVLMTQICWSADPSAAMCYSGPITRGPWAGHYFGIITVDNLSRDNNCINKQPWRDVTEKIVKEVLEIWRCDDPETLANHLRQADDESDNDRR